jgi:hypothetical protein
MLSTLKVRYTFIVQSNKYNWTRLIMPVSWTHNPHKQCCQLKMGNVKCRTVPQPIRHDSQWTPCVLHSPDEFSLDLVTFSGPPIHRTLLQQTFLWGYLKAEVFTHTLPDINSIKNAIPQEIANITQDTAMPWLSWWTSPWRIEDVRLFCESKTMTYLTVFSCIYCCVQ